MDPCDYQPEGWQTDLLNRAIDSTQTQWLDENKRPAKGQHLSMEEACGPKPYHSHAGLIRYSQLDVHLIQKLKDSEGTCKDTTNRLRNAMQSAKSQARSWNH
jgi:hypothetical protein